MKIDIKTLQMASLFRKIRALTRTMRKGTAWRLDSVLAIRHGDQCPLTFVGGMKGSNPLVATRAAEKLGLDSWKSHIIRAADFRYAPGQKHFRLRRILLKAAGLKEPK